MKFDIVRVGILASPYLKLINLGFLGLLVLGTTFLSFLYNWNGDNLTLFSVPLEGYTGSREQVFTELIHQLFSWCWILIGFYVFSSLLLPLTGSFLVSQLLWLRLNPCLPSEIAAARAIWVISYALCLSALGAISVLINSYFHHVSPTLLLLDALGLCSYILLSGGFILVTDFAHRFDNSSRILISGIASLLPILLAIISSSLSKTFGDYAKYFPYASPFDNLSMENLYHSGTAAIFGLFFLSFHIILKLRYNSCYPVVISKLGVSNSDAK
ncbi:MAG: hypothetical protein ACRCU2_00845 [Planktothrix sp.]